LAGIPTVRKKEDDTPYKSLAQAAKFHILAKQGKMSKSLVQEYDSASRGLALPKKVKLPVHKGLVKKLTARMTRGKKLAKLSE